MIKAPKLYFIDTGLVCNLLWIRSPDQLRVHPLRGAIFESWVALEILKSRLHRQLPAALFHLRETRGAELDLVVEGGGQIVGVEVKSGATVSSELLSALRQLPDLATAAGEGRRPLARLVYGGDTRQDRGGVEVLPWNDVQQGSWV